MTYRPALVISRRFLVLFLCSAGLTPFFLPSPTQAEPTQTSNRNPRVYGMGSNSHGELGDGSVTYKNVPVVIPLDPHIKAINGGDFHSVALKNDGTVWSWGDNSTSQQATPASSEGVLLPTQIKSLHDISAVSAGSSYTLALASNSKVYAWGDNRSGQLGLGVIGNQETSFSSTPKTMVGINSAIGISAGANHSLVVGDSGQVWACGENFAGQLGAYYPNILASPIARVVPRYLGKAVKVEAGSNFSLALMSNGTVYAWGNNSFGTLGDGSNSGRPTPVQVWGLHDIVALAAGGDHALALQRDGTVWAWGSNSSGQLGDGTQKDRLLPVHLLLSGIKQIAAGANHSLALKNDGTIYAWGANGTGQLGLGSGSNKSTPTLIRNVSRATLIGAGATTSFFVGVAPNVKPQINADLFKLTVPLDGSKAQNLDVLQNDTDIDHDNLLIVSTGTAHKGTVKISSDKKSLLYKPAAGYSGDDTFPYTVSDGTIWVSALVTVTDDLAPDAVADGAYLPVNISSVDQQTGNQVGDVDAMIDVLANDSDPDGDALTVTSVTQPVGGQVSIDPATGQIVYVAHFEDFQNHGFDSASFIYTVSDGKKSTQATVNVQFYGVFPPPSSAASKSQSATASTQVAPKEEATASSGSGKSS